ncbi:MAG: AAA family ATPase [Silvanigrellaceae bacterium]|nr:AAA family ATPase [Silvanigrellaceae bacterium]
MSLKTSCTVDKQLLKAIIGNITVRLTEEYQVDGQWIGNELASKQLEAAWLRLSAQDTPMNPRLIGKPGVGKTTLALCTARRLGLPTYLMQGTSDTRPDDLIITPVLNELKQISYVASPLVTAMLVGAVCVLDEGNRMSEKSWASLASLLDHRRYVDSIITGVRIYAHPEFRFVTTMNDDASVYDLPEYIQSRLCPQIFLEFSETDVEARILKNAVPYAQEELLTLLLHFLSVAHQFDEPYSVRDAIQMAKYAEKLKSVHSELNLIQALEMAIHAIVGEEALKFYVHNARFKQSNNAKSGPRPVE